MLVITIFCLSTYIALPNVMTSEFLPSTKLNLGLDIRGGISILLEADFSAYKQEQLLIIKNSISKELKGVKAHIYHDDIIFNCDIASLEKASSTILEKQYFSIKELNDEAILTIKKSFFHIKEINIIDRIIDVIRYRIDATGTQEITIQKQSNDCVLVQIPGTNDRAAIKNILSQTGSLKLHLVDVNITNEQIANHEIPLGIKLLPMTQDDNKIIELPIEIQPLMYGEMIADALPATYMGKHIVNFKLTDIGTRRFADITKHNVGKLLAIVLDNKIITAPTINEPILTGSGQISGHFTAETAQQLAILLRSGSLPVPIKIAQENVVGPTLGKEAVNSGANAVIIGCLAVILIMIAMYRGLGVIASLGLICNLMLMIAILSMIGATITLPGIAGMALTLGMAVDANVLIYERMKEEKNKHSVLQTINKGYDIALRTILDSNITTAIVALLLYIFGSSAIKGFAVTLIIGIICSMITAVFFSKVLIDFWYHIFKPKTLTL